MLAGWFVLLAGTLTVEYVRAFSGAGTTVRAWSVALALAAVGALLLAQFGPSGGLRRALRDPSTLGAGAIAGAMLGVAYDDLPSDLQLIVLGVGASSMIGASCCLVAFLARHRDDSTD